MSTSSNEGQIRQLSFCSKFWLVTYKNISVQLSEPLNTSVVLLAPLVFFMYSQCSQIMEGKGPIAVPQSIPNTILLTEPKLPGESSIHYSPVNPVIDKLIENVARGLKANKSQGYLYASDLENGLKKENAYVGIEFEDSLRNIMEIPSKIKVALRFPSHLRTQRYEKWPHNYFKRLETLKDNHIYVDEGFLHVQAILSDLILKEQNQSFPIPHVDVEPFPEKQHTVYIYLTVSYRNLILVFPLIFLLPSILVCQKIVAEKQSKIRNIFMMLGLTPGICWLSRFVVTLILYSIPAITIVILIKILMCPSGDIWVLLFIFVNYILSLVTFTFLITTFVDNTILAMVVTLLMHSISFIPYLLARWEASLTENMIVSLFLNSAMPMILLQLLGYEISDIGIQWKLIFKGSHPDDNLNVGYILIAMMVTTIFRLLACLYLDQLSIHQFEKRKKWYFPVQRNFWCPWDSPLQTHFSEDNLPADDVPPPLLASENVQHTTPAVVEAQNLYKIYKKDIFAVRDFSLKFYEDEITVLLGHNGAGKTSILKMIAGQCQPTFGKVLIHGENVVRHNNSDRMSVAIVLQYNMFYEELTPFWHITFFGLLKGLNRQAARTEAKAYLDKMNLTEKAFEKIRHLPVGTQRKVALCCALCANTKVVLCDEPTVGLDPLSRQDVWELLRMERYGRCIILSTPLMETAEAVGDQLVILCDGQLYGYGTSDFLIRKIGPGYRLVCVGTDACDVDELTEFLSNYIATIILESVVGADITYRLLLDDIHKYHHLFKQMERRLDILNLSSFWVTAPSLSETFLKIDSENIRQRSSELTNDWLPDPSAAKETDAIRRYMTVWLGLLTKKVLYTMRNPFLFAFIFFLPLFVYAITGLFDLVTKTKTKFDVPLYQFSVYPGAVVVTNLQSFEDLPVAFLDNIAEAYEKVVLSVGATVRDIGNETLTTYLLENVNPKEEGYHITYVAAVSLSLDRCIAFFNARLEHSATQSLGLVYKAIGQVLGGYDIEVINKPRPDSKPMGYIIEHNANVARHALFVALYMCVLVSVFVLLPISERVVQMRRQQLINGITVWTYWISHLLYDYLIFLLLTSIVLISFYYRSKEALELFIPLLLWYGFSALSLTYLMSLLYNSAGIGMSYIMFIDFVFVFAAFTMAEIRNDPGYTIVNKILMVIPHYAIYVAIVEAIQYGMKSTLCKTLPPGCSIKEEDSCCKLRPPNITITILYFFITGVICFTLVILFSMVPCICFSNKKPSIDCSIEDEDLDVANERVIINTIIRKEEQEYYDLICDKVSKKYQKNKAVNCVSIKLSSFGCFGLLGLSGAGKSTLMRMIVGPTKLTSGDIYVREFNIKNDRRKSFEYIGYCPQEGATFGYMTGRQMLKFTCLTSGFKRKYINDIIKQLADRFVLTEHLNTYTKYYSSGAKRKLNIAMSALGQSLICLDEPTIGVDIRAKQDIWRALKRMRDLGWSLLITTHSVDECKALCTNVAIMVKGQLRCIGSVQYLNTRFQRGIVIKIKVGTREDVEEYNRLTFDPESSSIITTPVGSQRFTSIPSKASTIEEEILNEKGTQTEPKKKKVVKPTKHRDSPTSSKISVKSQPKMPPIRKSTSLGVTEYSLNVVKETKFSRSEETFWPIMQEVERRFLLDFPTSYVTESDIYRGMLSIIIPERDKSWSTIFSYMAENSRELLIKHYSISQTTLDELFMQLSKDVNDDDSS